jgi:hypothetical protein
MLLLEYPHPNLALDRSGLFFGHGGMFALGVAIRFGRVSQIERARVDPLPTPRRRGAARVGESCLG